MILVSSIFERPVWDIMGRATKTWLGLEATDVWNLQHGRPIPTLKVRWHMWWPKANRSDFIQNDFDEGSKAVRQPSSY